MLRTPEILHICRLNELLRLSQIPTTNRPTPNRPIPHPVRQQNRRFVVISRVDGRADIADGDCKGTFPAGTLRARVSPLVLEDGLDSGEGGFIVVIIAGEIVGVERGIDDILAMLC